MVIFVEVTDPIMPSASHLGIAKAKKTNGKNRKRKSVVHALKNGNTKKLIKQQIIKQERKIEHYFLPQNAHKLENKTALTLEVAFDNNDNKCLLVPTEKENNSNSSASTVGFLKMSPYRSNQSPLPLRRYSREIKQKSLEMNENTDVSSQSWDHVYSTKQTPEKRSK